nr:DNA helicase [Tanacetum cinerariifolium]
MYVSAEFPSKEIDPEGHRIVSDFMIHDPCGAACPGAPCMKNASKCTKHFPKEYCNRTYVDKDGIVHYRRRDTGITTTKQNVQLDNPCEAMGQFVGRRSKMGDHSTRSISNRHTSRNTDTFCTHIGTLSSVQDIQYAASISLGIPDLHIHPTELEDYTIYEVEGCLNHCSRSLTDFGLRLPPENLMSVLRNRLLMEEKSYDRDLLAREKRSTGIETKQ